MRKDILIAIVFIVLVFSFGVAYTGWMSTSVPQTIRWYPCNIIFTPSSVVDQTVQATVDTLNLDFDASAKFISEYDTYGQPKPATDLRFSDDTTLFNVDSITGEITYSPPSSAVGSYVITITFYDANDVCMSKELSFNLEITAGPATAGPGGGGGGRSFCSIETVCEEICGSDRRKECTVYDECEGTSETYYQICVSEGGCSMADDCPQDYTCQEGICVAPISELEELPEEEAPIIVYPPDWQSFFNPEVVDYPSPGIIKALRQGLLTSSKSIDLSLYNLYYEPKETHLGVWMRERPLIRNFFLVLLGLSVIISMVVVVGIARTPKQPSLEYGMSYAPPEI